MDSLDREFSFLAASAEQTSEVQQAEAKAFLAEDPRRGGVLATHIDGAHQALRKHIEQRRIDYDDAPDREAKLGALTEMRNIVAGARHLQMMLGWLDAARTQPLDLGTQHFIEEAAQLLISAEAEITIVPMSSRSYGTLSNPLSSTFSLSGGQLPVGQQAVIVFIPRREQQSGLLHPLIVHELGHAAVTIHGLVDDVIERENDLPTELKAAAAKYGPPVDLDVDAAEVLLEKRLRKWIEEILCDFIAAQYLGPTYLYCFLAIVGTGSPDSAAGDHPPVRMRLRFLLQQLDELGWSEEIKSESREISEWCVESASVAHSYTSPEESFLTASIEKLSGPARQVVAEHLGEATFSATDYDAVKEAINEHLTESIPPAQGPDGDAIPRPAIVLASWTKALSDAGGDLEALAVAPHVAELSRLLPKSMELSAIVEAWRKT
jgi:hypothetical protein